MTRPLLRQEPVEPARGDANIPTMPIVSEVRDVDELEGPGAGRERTDELDPVVQRQSPDDPLQGLGVAGEG